MEKVKLIECIKTWQGEGPDVGIAMLLCRFKYCNKHCSFCDTLTKMRISQESEYKLKNLQQQIDSNILGLMITGGEPTIIKHFSDTVNLLNNLNYKIANVESNGYHLENLIKATNPLKNIHYIYSPKIFCEEDLQTEINNTTNLLKYHNCFIKIVYQKDNELLNEYIEWLDLQKKSYNKIWIMPEGKTKEELIKNSNEIFDICEDYNFNFTSRDHIIYNFI